MTDGSRCCEHFQPGAVYKLRLITILSRKLNYLDYYITWEFERGWTIETQFFLQPHALFTHTVEVCVSAIVLSSRESR